MTPAFLPLLLPLLLAAPAPQEPAPDLAGALRRHVEVLADDALQGRESGTFAGDQAAWYLAGAFEAAGLRPAGEGGTFLQAFPVALPPEPGECVVQAGRQGWSAGTLALSASASVSAPLVDAGYGVVLESHGMNEYRDADAEGKIVLVRRYSEFGVNPDPPFTELGALRPKLKAAAEAGAVGVILGTHPADLARGGEAEIPFGAAPGRLPIPVVTVAPEVVAALEDLLAREAEPVVTIAAEVQRSEARTFNVLGLLPGRSAEVLVVGAHYDHLGFGGEGSLAPGVHEVHNGADDNASGSAVVLELARRMAAAEEPPERSVLFALWGAEERGLLGSAWWVKHPTVEGERILANLNLDMVGRLQGGAITVGSAETCAAFEAALEAASPDPEALAFRRTGGSLPGGGGSDHMSFHQAEIPALFFFSGLHADYHKPSDDAEKLDYGRMAVLTEALDTLVRELGRRPRAEFAWVAPAPDPRAREVRGSRAWFGSIPDYAAAPEGGGMQIAGVSPGGPAEKAGLQEGDILKRVGGEEIHDIYDFMDAMADRKPGDRIEVVFLREGEELRVEVVLGSRGG